MTSSDVSSNVAHSAETLELNRRLVGRDDVTYDVTYVVADVVDWRPEQR